MRSMDEQSVDTFKALRILSSEDTLSQRDLSNHMAVSLGKTNYLIKALVRKGFVKIKNFYCRDKKLKKVRYILTKKGLEEKIRLTYYFLKRKENEYLELKRELEELAQKQAAGTKNRGKADVYQAYFL